jgi:hypothetical protein
MKKSPPHGACLARFCTWVASVMPSSTACNAQAETRGCQVSAPHAHTHSQMVLRGAISGSLSGRESCLL